VAAPRKYPDELRERAVRLYREADPKPVIRRLAEQLNVHPEALRNWIRQDQADRGERDDQRTTEMIDRQHREDQGGQLDYRCTVAEHARVVESFVEQLGLRDVTLMVQDWGGPIGFTVATRHPDWFRAFVIGNTWAWPMRGDRPAEAFSKLLGSRLLGGLLVKRADVFVRVFMRGGIARKKLSGAPPRFRIGDPIRSRPERRAVNAGETAKIYLGIQS
jgi:transposase-like protein